jgi:phosphoribosylformylglycinamidine synthase
VDLQVEKRAGECVRDLIANGLVTAVHDCSDGGVAVTIAEMALAGNIGLTMTIVPQIANPGAILFGEDQGRYVVSTSEPDRVRAIANQAQLFTVPIGTTGGDALVFDLLERGGRQRVTLADLRAAHEGLFPRLMGSELTPEF